MLLIRRLGLALALAGAAIVPPLGVKAEPASQGLSFIFTGRVEPIRTVTVANRVDGVIEDVLFVAGQSVAQGDPLFQLDARTFEIAVDRARAVVARAEAELRLAKNAAIREARLVERGSGAQVRAFEAEIAAEMAQAELDEATADFEAALLDLERTQVPATIAGRIGRSTVAPGAIVEAEAGTALAEIVQLDPVLVAYGVPYEARMTALKTTAAGDVESLLANVSLMLELPSGERYPHQGTPRFESAQIDQTSGMLTTWAAFPNPDGALVPGLEVRVLSTVANAEDRP